MNIDGNAIIAQNRKKRNSIPKGSGRIVNRNTGEVIERNGSDAVAFNPDDFRQYVPEGRTPERMDGLYQLVRLYNEAIDQDDLNEQKVDFNEYFDEESPNYIDPTDPRSVDREARYLMNEFYRLKKDPQYVPDYEDVQEMNDRDYEDYIKSLGLEQEKEPVRSDFDNMSDDQFTNIVDKFTGSEPSKKQSYDNNLSDKQVMGMVDKMIGR